jgi:hypothetical protein
VNTCIPELIAFQDKLRESGYKQSLVQSKAKVASALQRIRDGLETVYALRQGHAEQIQRGIVSPGDQEMLHKAFVRTENHWMEQHRNAYATWKTLQENEKFINKYETLLFGERSDAGASKSTADRPGEETTHNGDKATEDKATEDKATEDKTTEDKATEDKATKDNRDTWSKQAIEDIKAKLKRLNEDFARLQALDRGSSDNRSF